MRTLLLAIAMATMAGPASAAPAPDSVATAAGDTLRKIVPLPAIEVSTTRLGDRAPLARSVLGRADLEERNWGQDTPMALATLPGAYAYSDAGNGIGYSYLTIRGFPQRRISVLIDGVPLNDPESHEVYWIDHPDLLASSAEAQVQRGVGSALYGAASVGGSVDLETAPFSETPRVSTSLTYGSFETKRLMVEGNSGRLEGGWNLYGRYSRIETFGYREQSGSRLWSYALSARRVLGNQSFRINLFGGPEETHLAYLGVARDFLDRSITGDRRRDRRYNPITYKNERDHFFEPHYELLHSWSPAPTIAASQTLFYFDGKGYYDERRFGEPLSAYRLDTLYTADGGRLPPDYYLHDADGNIVVGADGRYRGVLTDVVRRRTIADRHYGWLPRMRIEHPSGALTIGGELRAHDGRHWGEVLTGNGLPPSTEPDHLYYDFHPRTLSGGLYLREEWTPSAPLLVTADLAWRHQSYFMRGDHFDGIRFDQPYDFPLPRLGVTYTPRERLSVFVSWSQAQREPALRDLFDGEGAGSIPLYRRADTAHNLYEDPLVRPERVNDYEVGGGWRGRGASLTANLFRMDFRDELVSSGQFNLDLGYPILGNAAKSVHQGVELAVRGERRVGTGLNLRLDANSTLSDNHLIRYREFDQFPGALVADSLVELRYDGNRIGGFPSVLGNLSARVSWRGASLGADMSHAGRLFVDNSEEKSASISPRTVLDLIGGVTVPWGASSHVELSVRVNNVFDRLYETGGYSYYYQGVKYVELVPAATRNVLTQVRVDF